MRKTKIVITFDKHGNIDGRAYNVTPDQVMRASMELNKLSRRLSVKKKPNKLVRFIKRFISEVRRNKVTHIYPCLPYRVNHRG